MDSQIGNQQGGRERIKGARRIVIKIGTRTISQLAGQPINQQDSENSAEFATPMVQRDSSNNKGVDQEFLRSIAQEVQALKEEGRQVLIVSSGAIGMGSRALRLAQKSQSIAMRQACASIGQPLLMRAYWQAFLECDIITAQILVTREQFNHRKSFNNLRTSVEKLLKLGAVPIINENDSISTEEIGHSFGDNDQLSAFMASKINADLLILLSDVDGLYDRNPHRSSHAHLISYVEVLEQRHLDAADKRGSAFSSGGMTTKLKAVSIAGEAGCQVVLANGRHEQIITGICRGEERGTLFAAAQPLKNRQRWIKNATAEGSLTIDSGALEAILAKGSLLPRGIIGIEGIFQREAVVMVNNRIKLISSFDSSELEKICGKHSHEIRQILGEDSPDVIARPENMVIL